MATVSVIMPTYDHARFIRRALGSLLAQTFTDWELWIVDDGSPDNTADIIAPFRVDPRIHYTRFETNQGLGAALNYGMDQASGEFIAYLPSDDLYYADHLASLVECLKTNPAAVLAYSAIRRHYNRTSPGRIEGYSLQLVQVLHRRNDERWLERHELVTENYEWMMLDRLKPAGEFVCTGQLTCEWVDHPHQLHKLIREPVGGINTFRDKFKIPYPMKYRTMVGNYMDEAEHYRRFRERPDTPLATDGLKILLVGELAYNPERVLALEEAGHKLYGLWMEEPYWYNAVGPQPFGHVQDLPRNDWKNAIRRIKPDIIYALLNWQAVPFAHHVMTNNPGVPFVWHYKEGPFLSLEKGQWNELIDLHLYSDGQIYSSPEMRDWYETVVPGSVSRGTPLVIDGDLPKRDWLDAPISPKLSARDGEIHTVVPGRPIGHHPEDVAELAELGIHLHFYGDFTHGQWLKWIERTKGLAPNHIHLHSQVDQEGWVQEFSQYDAGWVHVFESTNYGELRRANWDDLNYPARIATLVAAGLPILQYDNSSSIVATQSLVRSRDIGLFYKKKSELRAQMDDANRMAQVRSNVWRQREEFTFDYHTPALIEFFRQVIQAHSSKKAGPHAKSYTVGTLAANGSFLDVKQKNE